MLGNTMYHKKPLIALALLCVAGLSQAGEKEELLKLRNTTTSLIKQLVKQGILTDKMATEMLKQAEIDANQQVAEAKVSAPKEKEVVPADEVRVQYVPDFVKDEIRQQVRADLKNEVVGDVMQKAKKEKWGLPEALPDWVNRFKLSGDMRIREQSTFMASDNTSSMNYSDWQTINSSGGVLNAGENQHVNTKDDRSQARERFRLGIDVNVANGLDASVRLATGNITNPISTNQSLGNYGNRYQFNIDRAFLKYNVVDDNKFNWLTVMGGRTPNPFFTGGSEVVWDEDLSFEGLAGTVRHNFNEGGFSDAMGGKGATAYATFGIFPLQASSGMSARDKWLLGGQTGVDWGFDNQDSLKFASAYYDYQNIRAVTDPSLLTNAPINCGLNAMSAQSVPQFMQFGNTLTPVCGPVGQQLYGLASDYKILNFNALYDIALFSPHHVKLSADYAKNIGFDANDIQKRYVSYYVAGLLNNNSSINDVDTNAWQVRADIGWPKVDIAGHWSVFGLYKHVGSDAVLDAYTDSDFHQAGASNLGGTNVKGWIVGGNYGLMKNVWLTGKWFSGNVITGPQFGVDMMQLDVNTHF